MAATEPRSATEFFGLRALLVEDHDDSRQALEMLLTEAGITVYAAASAAAALELFQRHEPNLVISDIGLPDEDGHAIMRRIRRLPRGALVPAIALTGFCSAEVRQKTLIAGFHIYLTKPLQVDQLFDAIRTLLGSPTR